MTLAARRAQPPHGVLGETLPRRSADDVVGCVISVKTSWVRVHWLWREARCKL